LLLKTQDLNNMAINPAGTLPPDLFAQQQQLNRQQQMAQLLMQQGQQQPQGQMVSGRFVPTSFFQNITPLVQLYAGQKLGERGDKAMADLLRQQSERQQKVGQEFFESISPSQQTEMAGPYGKGVGPEGRDIPMPIAGLPDFKNAVALASDPNAPAYVKNYVNELLKPRTFKEGETLQMPSFAGGQVSFNQMAGGGVSLPSDLKSIAIRLGLPTDQTKWTEEQRRLIDTAARADKAPPVTNLTVNTGKAYTGAFGEGIAKEDLSKYSIAEKAPSIYQNALATEDLIKKGAITGLGADFKLNLARALNVTGVGNDELIKNTEQLVANRGQIVLDSIKASGLGAGQGFTDKDRQFLEKVKGGTIELNSKTLLELAKIEKRVAQSAVDSWNKRIPSIPKEAIQGTGVGPVQLQQNQWRVK
jgi:hypothetical protein